MADSLNHSKISLSPDLYGRALTASRGRNPLRPEWIRLNTAVQLFGVSRSRLYDLIAERKIKSFALRERNQIKGTRLISFDSLCEFFEKEAQSEQEANEYEQ
jgi:hypothetical protein